MPEPASQASASTTLARHGSRVALAGAVGRITGFARSVALAAVLGTAAVGESYNGANTSPNMVYELLIGGVLSSAVLPLLMRARRHGRKHSREFTQRLLVAATLAMAALTLAAIAGAPLIVRIFVADSGERHLTTLFAYLLLPEIFCYGLAALLTAVLNVRESFAAAAWAPVVNNLIVLATAGAYVLIPGPVVVTPATMSGAQVAVLGIGTTAGIAGQAVWVAMALRRTGFRWSWRVRPLPYTWRPVRAGAPMLGWIVGYVALSQLGVALTLRVAFDHGGVSVNYYADLLFQVPNGIVAVSLLTVLMPRLARAAAAGDDAAVVADLGRGARYLVTALIPVTVAMALLGPVLAQVVFTGRVDPAAARLIGASLALSAFGLAPFALVMLQMRVCYAHNDLRTPTLINGVMVAVKIVVIAVAAALAPPHVVVVMLGVGGSLSYVAGAVLGHVLLRRRYGLLGFSAVAATFTRVVWAAAAAGWAGLLAMASARHLLPDPIVAHLLMAVVGAAAGAAVFLLAATVIGIPEVRRARSLLSV